MEELIQIHDSQVLYNALADIDDPVSDMADLAFDVLVKSRMKMYERRNDPRTEKEREEAASDYVYDRFNKSRLIRYLVSIGYALGVHMERKRRKNKHRKDEEE